MKASLLGCFAAALLAAAPASAETFTGLVAYSSCAVQGKITPEEHAKCAQGTSRDDEVLVFAVDKKTVYEIFEEDRAEEFIGKYVEIHGVLDEGFIEIEAIEPAESPKK